MEIKIKMLDVGDGDCIIIHLTKAKSEQFVILIDGGHAGDAAKTIIELEKILNKTGKQGPDLIICTHYDSDHIGGLKKVVEKYKKKIGQVWIHEPGLQKAAIEFAQKVNESKVVKGLQNLEVIEYKNEIIKNGLNKESDLVLESYNQMTDLVACLKKEGVKHLEPFSNQSIEGWEEIKVLGPSKEFYNSCYSKLVKPKSVILSEIREMKESRLFLEQKSKKAIPDPCGFLDKQKKDHVTEVNQVSVILQITANDKKYLFTGDSSLESFKNLPGYPDNIKDIYWLKVAHHGSHNNSSCELFDIMKPQYAYISGGDQYLDDEVPECLKKKGAIVKTTRDDGDIEFPIK